MRTSAVTVPGNTVVIPSDGRYPSTQDISLDYFGRGQPTPAGSPGIRPLSDSTRHKLPEARPTIPARRRPTGHHVLQCRLTRRRTDRQPNACSAPGAINGTISSWQPVFHLTVACNVSHAGKHRLPANPSPVEPPCSMTKQLPTSTALIRPLRQVDPPRGTSTRLEFHAFFTSCDLRNILLAPSSPLATLPSTPFRSVP